MDKAEIRAKAENLGGDLAVKLYREVIKQDEWNLFMTVAEAALTAAHTAGGKDEYERGWNEGVEAAAITVGPSIHLGKEQVARVREQIRRLKKGK